MMRIWDDLTPDAQAVASILILMLEAFLLWG